MRKKATYCVFLVVLIIAAGCSGQQNTGKPEKLDTAKLFNPTGHENNVGADDKHRGAFHFVILSSALINFH